ncbi:SurA N-terminal domain-containing protein [Pusillimonas sp. CC-YST705]|uniref:Periplasmic chaperone PpiD n=1 Tax=Mesopusillimonas faecipullorum TaxID=2755040 RepID=A0ABS8CC42_9BURK|nr:SurA N-terminal domain-containing protein [Mesopusillimonas faecipullorum]MCB5363174.1 SurA N-terminal domain-containing protein [Mesopusillimonas faecipullorum]
MFDFIRTHQRLMQLILLVLIVPSFALFGVSSYTSFNSGDQELVEVGNSGITLQEFDQARREQLQRIQANMGAAFDPAVVDTPETRLALLDSLIERRVLIDQLQQHHFTVSDAALRRAIAAIPDFQEDGRFSAERYRAVLASMGLNSKDFEEGQRGELALQRVLGPVAATAHVPDATVTTVGQALTERRVVRQREFPLSAFEADVQVDDAQIKAWYEANQQALSVPEYATVEYLVLDEAAATQSLPAINESDLRAYYDQNKSRYVQAARSNVSHIQFAVPADASEAQRAEVRQQAQQVADQAAADTTQFAELAKTHSQDAGTSANGGQLGWITRGTWPAEIESAVFELKQGQVSGVVEVSGNYHVFLANEVQPEQGESFEQARAQVEQEVKRQLAADRYAELATRLTEQAYEDNSSLVPAAQALGLEVRKATGVAVDRLLSKDVLPETEIAAAIDNADAQLLDDPRVRRALFSEASRKEQHSSGVIEIAPGVMVVVRAETLHPAQVRPLEQAREFIREQLVAEKAREAATQAGEKVLASLREAEGKASEEGFSAPITVSRMDAQGLGSNELKAIFEARSIALPAFIGVENEQGYAIVRLEEVQEGELESFMSMSLRAQLDQAQAVAEQQAVLAAMREQAKVKMLPEAKQALEQTDEQDS